MKIEYVNPSDAKSLLEIYAPYVKNTAITFEYEVPSVEEFTQRIINISQKYPYIKAVDDDGKIAGYAYAGTFKGRRAYDWSVETTVYVRKDGRRQGTGRLLYEELERLLKKIGITNMNACITCPQNDDSEISNRDSMRFHEKMGFTLVGTFHFSGYKFGQWFNMIWMEKMIGDHLPKMQDVKFGKWKD